MLTEHMSAKEKIQKKTTFPPQINVECLKEKSNEGSSFKSSTDTINKQINLIQREIDDAQSEAVAFYEAEIQAEKDHEYYSDAHSVRLNPRR